MSELFVNKRREIKYLVEPDQLAALDAALRPLLSLDKNNPNDEGYYNYTIYFDSHDNVFWHSKIEGLSHRVKPRLRVYKPQIDAAAKVHFLEFKHRHDHFIAKERVRLRPEVADAVLHGNALIETDLEASATLGKFLYMRNLHGLKPKVVVLYRRYAYAIDMHHGLRITYDCRLQASRLTGFDVPPRSFLLAERPERTIVEVKYNGVVPRWLLNIFERLELERVSYSKYATCMERIAV